jgi:hypothetical protein
VAAWSLVPLSLAAATVGLLEGWSEARLQLGRERLLAGRPQEAVRALGGVRWPPLAGRARAGRLLAAALSSAPGPPLAAARPIGDPAGLLDIGAFSPEAVLVAALARGDVDAAGRTADLLSDVRHAAGPLYSAALAFDRGEEEKAARLAATAPVALLARGPGQRLAAAMEARRGGARTLLWDHGGRLVATIDAEGRMALTAEARGALDQPLAVLADGADELPRGASVRLTLDAHLSRVALHALGVHHGSIVLLEPRTGALRAAVSDVATFAREGPAAFTQRREPASIAKVLTAAAAYRAGHDPDAAIARMTCTGVERYGGQPLWCAWPAGPLEGLDHALGVSCNVAFANLALLVGRERLVAEYRLWGFDGGARALLGAAGRVHGALLSPRDLADLGIGLEQADITPLHAALLAAVVADGRLAAPHVVAGTSSMLALRTSARPRPSPHEVVPRPTAARLRRAMEAVARRGTAAGLAPEGLDLAMKTGTGATAGAGYHVNYVGLASRPSPGVAFCVRITGGRSSPAVTRTAREVTRRLLRALATGAPFECSPSAAKRPHPPGRSTIPE